MVFKVKIEQLCINAKKICSVNLQSLTKFKNLIVEISFYILAVSFALKKTTFIFNDPTFTYLVYCILQVNLVAKYVIYVPTFRHQSLEKELEQLQWQLNKMEDSR